MPAAFSATASIKLVIWDLDDTFWEGTLSEGPVQLIDRNIEIVKTLADRGIMSSIVSKNDMAPVKEVLVKAGIWDYFIFPHVSWNPKGGSLLNIVEQSALRPDNILFLDDNSINREEARFCLPQMMIADPVDALPVLLDIDQTKGKDDRSHSRLKQYKQLEKKVSDQATTTLSNAEFLKQCDIRLRFDYHVENHLDRVIELINRTNQLNYTKNRLENESQIAAFKAQLDRHDMFAAVIYASDRYGDHGLIGFYLQQKNERENRLLHYVWSCRMMNAGLEQYVYEKLGEPKIDVVQPVSNPIKSFPSVDWIQETQGKQDDPVDVSKDPRVLLIGSCDLTAVASYCSRNRSEFVNGIKNDVMTRYDDFGFILGDASKIQHSTALEALPSWSGGDFVSFQQELHNSNVLIVSLSAALRGDYLLTDDGVAVRVHPEGLGHFLDSNGSLPFLKRCQYYSISEAQSLQLLEHSLRSLGESAPQAGFKFLLGANSRKPPNGSARPEYLELMTVYNNACREFCARNKDWTFISIDEVIPEQNLIDDRHYNRAGYIAIANEINKLMKSATGSPSQARPDSNRINAVDLISQGRKLSRSHLFGPGSKGTVGQIKKLLKQNSMMVKAWRQLKDLRTSA
jgi:FkbH-like protein